MNDMMKTNYTNYPPKRSTTNDFSKFNEIIETKKSVNVSRKHSPLENQRHHLDNAKSELDNKVESTIHFPAMK